MLCNIWCLSYNLWPALSLLSVLYWQHVLDLYIALCCENFVKQGTKKSRTRVTTVKKLHADIQTQEHSWEICQIFWKNWSPLPLDLTAMIYKWYKWDFSLEHETKFSNSAILCTIELFITHSLISRSQFEVSKI